MSSPWMFHIDRVDATLVSLSVRGDHPNADKIDIEMLDKGAGGDDFALETCPRAPIIPKWQRRPPRNRALPNGKKAWPVAKAQIAAGESVPLLPVLDRLRASAERLEA